MMLVISHTSIQA